MQRFAIIIWSAIVAACSFGGAKPPVTPNPPAVTVYTLAAIVADQYGTPIEGAAITLSPEAGAYTPTNRYGYTAREVAAGAYTVTASTDCCGTASTAVTVDQNRDARLTVTRQAPRPTDAELHYVLANFCNLRDAAGRVIFTADYAGLDDASRRDWMARLVAAGSTHVAISPMGGGYPGTPLQPFDLRADPARFAAVVREIMNTAGANGKALTPILLLDGGEPGIRDRIRAYWPGLRQALGDDVDRVLVVPGWELIKASDTTSADYSFALTFLHDQGWPHLWAHLSPGRASASSNPPEDDDPWQGAESGMWKSNGGQYVEGLLYQSEAVRPDDDRCDPAQDDCWLNRWEDVVPRIGAGMNGWRIMHLAYFEGPAYYYYRGQSDEAFARRIAAAAQAMCAKYGVVCGFGNGLPGGGR